MINNCLEEKAVIVFLNTYQDDEALRRYFLRKFDSPGDVFWNDKATSTKIEFSAIEDGVSRSYWLNEFCNYSYLFLFSKLFLWHKKWERNDILYKRLCIFVDKYFDKITAELTTFPFGTNSLPVTFILNMGLWTDQYRWHKYRKSPYFILYAKEKNVLNEEFYAKYADVLYTTNQEYSLKKSFEELMEYFSATDFVVGKSLCLCAFLAAFFHEETRKHKVEEFGCEYVPSVIKWESSHKFLCVFVLLDYLERKLSNTNGIGPKAKFYMNELNSEMEQEKSLLGDKKAERFESIFQTIKKGKEKCDDAKNKNICYISAGLYGKTFYRGYSPSRNYCDLMKICCKEDFPVKRNVRASWEFNHLDLGDTIDFELDVQSSFSNKTLCLASFSRKYIFRKSLWEKLISLSGKPELIVSVKMDIEFTDASSCAVSNIEWAFEKRWPSSPSDYVYGGDIGIDSVYHP